MSSRSAAVAASTLRSARLRDVMTVPVRVASSRVITPPTPPGDEVEVQVGVGQQPLGGLDGDHPFTLRHRDRDGAGRPVPVDRGR
nr:hypothetical protein GCM10020092_063730 [Actinoplanes digitatis]